MRHSRCSADCGSRRSGFEVPGSLARSRFDLALLAFTWFHAEVAWNTGYFRHQWHAPVVGVNIVEGQPYSCAPGQPCGFDAADMSTDLGTWRENISIRSLQRLKCFRFEFLVHLMFAGAQFVVQANKKMSSIGDGIGGHGWRVRAVLRYCPRLRSLGYTYKQHSHRKCDPQWKTLTHIAPPAVSDFPRVSPLGRFSFLCRPRSGLWGPGSLDIFDQMSVVLLGWPN